MARVVIHTGAVEAGDRIDEVPRTRWTDLVRAWRSFGAVSLPYDCRLLLQIFDQAQRIYADLGYASVEDLFRRGIELDPDLVKWALHGLKAIKPEQAVPFEVAVSEGKRVQELADRAVPLGEHGGARGEQGDDITLSDRGTSAAYLTSRIARDRPDILEAMKRGEYPSVRRAAIAANIIIERTPAERIRKLYKKLLPAEQAEFLAWLEDGSAES